MTKKNTNSREPFLLKPVSKNYLWGGQRLRDDFSKEGSYPLAETWECSTHPDGESLVASGMYTGQTLSSVIQKHPEILGTRMREQSEFPILIKFIDAKENLSVQVHPDDEYARLHEHGQNGKTEMWYVVDAEEDASLIYGLRHDITASKLKESIKTGTLELFLQKVPIRKNDVFFLRPGTIHAIGAGALIVEVQQNSNITYRLYDYDRIDRNGSKRPLHIDRALEVATLNKSNLPTQPLRILRYQPGYASESLCHCAYFYVERVLINTERHRSMVALKTSSLSFEVLVCIEGCGSVFFHEKKDAIHFIKGDSIFLPADCEYRVHGMCQLIKVGV